MSQIIRNMGKCLSCNDIIESKYRHDMQFCSCGKNAVDGGLAYLRRVGGSDNWEELSEWEEEEQT